MRLSDTASCPFTRIASWLLPLLMMAAAARGGEPLACSACGKNACASWDHALALALMRTDEAKGELQKLASSADRKAVKDLAAVLLEEWDLSPAEKRLATPYAIWAPRVDTQGEKVTSPLVVILGVVLPDGSFLPSEFKVRSGNQRVDERCLRAASRSRFRPARRDSGFARASAAISFHFYL